MNRSRIASRLTLAALLAAGTAAPAPAQWTDDPSQNNVFATDILGGVRAQTWVPRPFSTGGHYAFVNGSGLLVQSISGTAAYIGAPVVIDAGADVGCDVVGVSSAGSKSIFAYRRDGGIYVVVVNLIGGILMGPTLVSSSGSVCFEGAAICQDDDDGAILAWAEFRWTSSFEPEQSIRAARIDHTSGAYSVWATSTNGPVTTTDDLFSVRIAPLPKPWGGVVAWLSRAPSGQVHAETARANWAASFSGHQDVLDPNPSETAMELKVVTDPDDPARHAYYGMLLKSGTRRIVTQRIDASGARNWLAGGTDAFVGNSTVPIAFGEDPFAIAATGSGGLVVVTNTAGGAANIPIRLAIVSLPGLALHLLANVNSGGGMHYQPDVLMADGHAIVAFQSLINSLPRYLIHAQRIDLVSGIGFGSKTWNGGNDVLISDRFDSVSGPVVTPTNSSCGWVVQFRNRTGATTNGCGQWITHNVDNGYALGRQTCSGPFGPSSTPIGMGTCALPAGLGSGAGGGTPGLGSTFIYELDNLQPASPFVLFLGISAPSSPVPLGGLGATGCEQYVDPLVNVFGLSDAMGVGQFHQQIPNDPSFINLSIYAQGGVVDSAANPLGLTTTNGLRLVIGL